MDPQWSPLREPAAQRAWQAVLVPIAAELRASAANLAERAVERMQAELPHLFPDEPSRKEALVSTDASLQQLAELIEIGGDPRQTALPPSTQAIARAAVQRQALLPDLMRFYRLAQELVWTWLFTRITAAADDAAQQAKALELATGWIFGYVDGAQMRAEQTYELEREAWLRGTAAARAAAIDDIVAQRERDTQRASKRLRYDVARTHVAVIAWLDRAPDETDPQTLLGGVIAGIAHDTAADSTLVHPSGTLGVLGWLSRRGPCPPEALARVSVGDPHAGVRVALGEPGQGLKGFRRTYLEAAHARRVASLTGSRAAAVTRYRSVAVAALASADREHARSFVTRVLGPLAADDEDTYRVATTLAVYLAENRSPTRAARRLTVHPNTVSYRVNQAETILGRGIDTDTLELSVALALLPTLPGMAHPEPDEL
ncbi:helix-turn-helix domain-containing protein [Mycobacterium sp. Y57]|uniref:PucR family transcriptional regulator n=1 Tax=Mycolicibacterium xanthum TaxID=2796469 RepID=UPI001C862651|nr:helix-turn-helix domain-containing protein [Mycolicibacterium xanthum]MBX7433957.1 helix-turn-helix domain-containing protein [Mycolicibacterium xanthum]